MFGVWLLLFLAGTQASNPSRLKNFFAKFQQGQTISCPKCKPQKFKPVITGAVIITVMQNVRTTIK